MASACSNGDGEKADGEKAEQTTTTVTPMEDVTVRVVAQIVGLGCTGTAPVGKGSQLVVLDPSGTRLGIGTFDLSPGLVFGVDTCDWTAVVEDVPADFDVYVLEGDGEELATVDLAAMGWSVDLVAGVSGVQVAP
jgi:hypothetical protein